MTRPAWDSSVRGLGVQGLGFSFGGLRRWRSGVQGFSGSWVEGGGGDLGVWAAGGSLLACCRDEGIRV